MLRVTLLFAVYRSKVAFRNPETWSLPDSLSGQVRLKAYLSLSELESAFQEEHQRMCMPMEL